MKDIFFFQIHRKSVKNHSENTHVHELHICLGSSGLIKDLDGHRNFHSFTLWDPNTLKR